MTFQSEDVSLVDLSLELIPYIINLSSSVTFINMNIKAISMILVLYSTSQQYLFSTF